MWSYTTVEQRNYLLLAFVIQLAAQDARLVANTKNMPMPDLIAELMVKGMATRQWDFRMTKRRITSRFTWTAAISSQGQ